jgi:hypothetical protein
MGIPGIISVIALVFAMTGGAYAAKDAVSGKANSSAKGKQGPRGKRGPVGPAGPIGPVGAQGATGAQGERGEKGEKGDAGNQGIQGEQGVAGEDGSPWVVGTAPSGVVMKGTWAIQGKYEALAANEEIPVPISTGVPVNTATGLLAFYVPPGGPDPSGNCTGSSTNPLPPTSPAVVCVYAHVATNLKAGTFGASGTLGKSGGGVTPLLRSNAAGLVSGYGSWALRTP